MLKSTPPAWAGTNMPPYLAVYMWLKSTPPAWVGTVVRIAVVVDIGS